MEHSKSTRLRLAAAAVIGAGLLAASPASALITCNSNGDCWRTETRVTYPNVTFSYHEDPWWDEHKTEKTYVFHDTSPDYDVQRGYWARGVWVRVP